MPSLGVVMACCDELTRRGPEPLARALASLDAAAARLAAAQPDVTVHVGACDDASTDGTPAAVAAHFAGRPHWHLARLGVRRGLCMARNVAASLFASDWLCFFDPDDEYLPLHLEYCARVMREGRDARGQRVLWAWTRAALNVPVHPDWGERIAGTIVLTKVVDRRAWDFVEGMPAEAVYSRVGCEDQFFARKLMTFFTPAQVAAVTVRHYAYPGNFLDRQRPKFAKPFAAYDPRTDDDPGLRPWHALRERHEDALLAYLRRKWQLLDGPALFAGCALAPHE